MSSVADLARANARSRQSGLRNFIEPIAEDYTASLRGMGQERMQITLCKKVFSASGECRQRDLPRCWTFPKPIYIHSPLTCCGIKQRPRAVVHRHHIFLLNKYRSV